MRWPACWGKCFRTNGNGLACSWNYVPWNLRRSSLTLRKETSSSTRCAGSEQTTIPISSSSLSVRTRFLLLEQIAAVTGIRSWMPLWIVPASSPIGKSAAPCTARYSKSSARIFLTYRCGFRTIFPCTATVWEISFSDRVGIMISLRELQQNRPKEGNSLRVERRANVRFTDDSLADDAPSIVPDIHNCRRKSRAGFAGVQNKRQTISQLLHQLIAMGTGRKAGNVGARARNRPFQHFD